MTVAGGGGDGSVTTTGAGAGVGFWTVVELNEQAAIAKEVSPSNAKALMVELLGCRNLASAGGNAGFDTGFRRDPADPGSVDHGRGGGSHSFTAQMAIAANETASGIIPATLSVIMVRSPSIHTQ